MNDNIHILNHPLLQHKLTILRNKETSTKDFRELVCEIAMPPYSLGYGIPISPILPSFSTASSGNSFSLSSRNAKGLISSSANARILARSSSCCCVV